MAIFWTHVLLFLLVPCREWGVGSAVLKQLTDGREDGNVKYIIRDGHYIDLDCSSRNGSDTVYNWTKWDESTQQWKTYIPNRPDVKFNENKNVIYIHSAIYEDSGIYKCYIRDSTSITETVTTYHLDVIACDKLARGPFAVSPIPCDKTDAHLGDTLTLPCTGYFGCSDEGDIRLVTWFVSRGKDKSGQYAWAEAASFDDRYTQVEFQKYDSVMKGANLTITKVTDDDFHRKFMCLLASPQQVHGETKLVITLKKGEEPLSFASAIQNVLVFVTLILLIFSITVIIITLRRLRMIKETKSYRNKDERMHEKLSPHVQQLL